MENEKIFELLEKMYGEIIHLKDGQGKLEKIVTRIENEVSKHEEIILRRIK